MKQDCEDRQAGRIIRGPRGRRGADGLSAYGVWLREGNTGTEQDFLNAIAGRRQGFYLAEDAEQYLYRGDAVAFFGRPQMETDCVAIKGERIQLLREGIYCVRFFLAAKNAVFGLRKNGREIAQSRYMTETAGGGISCFKVERTELPATLELFLASERAHIQGTDGAMTAAVYIEWLGFCDVKK